MVTVVLASPGDDASMGEIIGAIDRAGVPVVGVQLDPRETDDAIHDAQLRAALAGVPGPVIIGGFSLGGRIAARLCPELSPLALLCLGYPFHAAKRAHTRHGLDTLSRVSVPTRIIQGSRDPHGSEADVRGYALAGGVELVWLADGNHRFVPRERSGLTHAEHIRAAAAAAISFIHAHDPCSTELR